MSPALPSPALPSPDPIHISARFQLTLRSAILALQTAAAEDERVLPLLDDPDQRRRQQLLVDRQLDRAFQLNELLAGSAIRPVEPLRANAACNR
jgi:hypothetical protein